MRELEFVIADELAREAIPELSNHLRVNYAQAWNNLHIVFSSSSLGILHSNQAGLSRKQKSLKELNELSKVSPL